MARLIINPFDKKSKIKKEIYGHFSEHLGRCIYEGLYVGEDSPIPNVNGMRKDVVEALKNIRIPVLRWPGGCFADEYHWKDGIGPKNTRKRMINTHWGGMVEDNSFGTHEFMELCSQLECEPYICGNVGSGTVQEMAEWVEYLTFDGMSPLTELRKTNGQDDAWKVNFWGVGNENWGCGGNMTAEQYALEYRRYQTYCRQFSGNKLYKIAGGANSGDYHWTEVLMRDAGKMMDGISLHMYSVTYEWDDKGSAISFDQDGWYRTLSKALAMETLVTGHSEIMNRYDPEKRVGLIVDEWGTWHNVEPGTLPGFLYQQNAMRDAMVAGITLDIFNKHSDRVHMANIAQTVNVLQAMVLTDGADMILTPTYHVFDLYKHHQDGTLISSFVEASMTGPENYTVPQLHESASIDKDGVLHITLNNLSATEEMTIESIVAGCKVKTAEAQIVTGEMDAHNTFEKPDTIAVKGFDGLKLHNGELTFAIPPCSVMHIALTVE